MPMPDGYWVIAEILLQGLRQKNFQEGEDNRKNTEK